MTMYRTFLPFIIWLVCYQSFNAHARTKAPDIEQLNLLKGTLVVVNKSDNSVSLIDLASGNIVNTLPTGQGPHELVVTSDGNWAISTNFVGGDSLTVFDLQAQKVARTISLELYPSPHGIRLLHDQQTVVFTSGQSQQLVFANIHTGTITKAVATNQDTTHMLAISAHEDYAYATNIRSNSISKIDIENASVIKHIPTELMPEAINITSNGKELWYGANKEGLVTVLDTSNYKQIAQFKGFSFPYRVLFSHQEKIAIVPDFRQHNVRFYDTVQKQLLGTLNLPENAGPQGITMHPTYDIAFLSLNLLNQVVAIDITTRKILRTYPTGNNPDGLAYSALVLD